MERYDICKVHKKDMTMFCKDCNVPMCYKCVVVHSDKECKCLLEITTYAKRYILPKYQQDIEYLQNNQKLIKESINNFTVLSEDLKKKIINYKEIIENLLDDLNNCMNQLDIIKNKNTQFENMKNHIENEYDELMNSITNEDMNDILKKIYREFIGIDLHKNNTQLIESINKLLNDFIDINKVNTLNEVLQEYDKKYKQYLKVVNNDVYGICNPQNNCKSLCKYNINDKKIYLSVNVPRHCTVSQIGPRIFISGGFDPYTNSLSEFIEKSQELILKEPMAYSKNNHAVEPISNNTFITVGGFNKFALRYCEKYSILDNKWSLLPLLNIARYWIGTAFIQNKYVYAIGGCDSKNSIEVFNINIMTNWKIINLASNDANFNNSPGTIKLSNNEIFIFCGNGTNETAIFNIKNSTVKKQSIIAKPDYYFHSRICAIGRFAYIIGFNGHIHILDMDKKQITEIDHSNSIAHST